MDAYEALISGGLPDAEQAKVLAAKLRGQDNRATLAMLSGDKVLAPYGKQAAQQVQTQGAGLSRARAIIENRQSEERRHAETQQRLKEQADAQRELTESRYQQLNQQHADSLAMQGRGQDATLDAAEMRIKLAQQKVDAAADKDLQSKSWKLASKLQSEGVIDLEGAVGELQATLAKYKGKDLPGIGPVDNVLHSSLMGKEGKEVRRQLAAVRNLVLKARSGAAVTDPEMRRLAEELELSIGKSDEDLIAAFNALANRLTLVKNNLLGGAGPEVAEYYTRNVDARNVLPGEMVPGDQQSMGNSPTPTEGKTSGGLKFKVLE